MNWFYWWVVFAGVVCGIATFAGAAASMEINRRVTRNAAILWAAMLASAFATFWAFGQIEVLP